MYPLRMSIVQTSAFSIRDHKQVRTPMVKLLATLILCLGCDSSSELLADGSEVKLDGSILDIASSENKQDGNTPDIGRSEDKQDDSTVDSTVDSGNVDQNPCPDGYTTIPGSVGCFRCGGLADLCCGGTDCEQGKCSNGRCAL